MKKLKALALSMILFLGLGVTVYSTNDKVSNNEEKKYSYEKQEVLAGNKDKENIHKAVNENKENISLKTVSLYNADETKKANQNKVKTVSSPNKTSNTVKTNNKNIAKTSNKAVASRGNLKVAISHNAKELDLLARLVRAEAGGESYEAQVAVAAVVINRVQSSKFPNTITDVIYQNNQFTPIQNGHINKQATDTSKKAVQAALYGKDPTNGALFFYDTSCTSDWLLSKPVKAKIGKMVYAY